MRCEICGMYNNHHDLRCPNYKYPKFITRCDVCGEGICDGEEYIKNLDGEYVHYECVKGIRWLLDWLGYNIKRMEEP